MPGFNIDGFSGNQPAARVEFNRSYRWRIAAGFLTKEWVFVKSASRPKFNFDEMTMYHRHDRAYTPGRFWWDPIKIEFYDALDSENTSVAQRVFRWMIGDKDGSVMSEDLFPKNPRVLKNTTVTLEMLDGEGSPTETWELYNAWPVNLDLGKLDFSKSGVCDISFDLRFDRAELIDPAAA